MAAYRQLLQDYSPRPIRSERAHRKALQEVDELMSRPRLSREERELLDVLVALVEQYESVQFPTPSNPPKQMLAHLMESRGVSNAELSAETGIPRSTIVAVLSGRRAIGDENVLKLATFFGVSSSVFVPPTAGRLQRKVQST